jgi:osmotically-inducible protein OsmY
MSPSAVKVESGQVILTGPMVDAQYIAEAVRRVRGVEGVTRVESHIVPLGFHPLEL